MICDDRYLDVQMVPRVARRSPCGLAVSLWHVPIILWSLPCFLAQQDIPSLFCTVFAPKRSSGFLLVENGTCFENECICSCAFSRLLLWQFLSAASLLIPSTCRGFPTSARLPPSSCSASTGPMLFLCWYLEALTLGNKQPQDGSPVSWERLACCWQACWTTHWPWLEKPGSVGTSGYMTSVSLNIRMGVSHSQAPMADFPFYTVRTTAFLFSFAQDWFPKLFEFWGL